MRDNTEELETVLQDPEVVDRPSLLLDAVRVCQCIIVLQLGEFEDLQLGGSLKPIGQICCVLAHCDDLIFES